MGRYSDSDDDYKRSKKKKKKARSSSSESSYSSYSSSKKHKKSKKKSKRKDKSPSRSPRRRGRSQSWSPKRSRSRSRGRFRSRSRSPKYRSTYRSRSRGRSRSPLRRRSRSPLRRRSRSPLRRRSRSRSYKRSRSRSVEKRKKDIKEDSKDPSMLIPGWINMTPAEQAEARLQMALKAAASVDENLREQGILPGKYRDSGSNSPLLFDTDNRNKAISDIESSGFSQNSFKSSRWESRTSSDLNDLHDSAIFGGDIKLGAGGEMTILSTSSQPLKDKDNESLMHPNLYVSAEEKMDRWIQKLKAFRRSKLEGKAMK